MTSFSEKYWALMITSNWWPLGNERRANLVSASGPGNITCSLHDEVRGFPKLGCWNQTISATAWPPTRTNRQLESFSFQPSGLNSTAPMSQSWILVVFSHELWKPHVKLCLYGCGKILGRGPNTTMIVRKSGRILCVKSRFTHITFWLCGHITSNRNSVACPVKTRHPGGALLKTRHVWHLHRLMYYDSTMNWVFKVVILLLGTGCNM